jgi:hypothetical protein
VLAHLAQLDAFAADLRQRLADQAAAARAAKAQAVAAAAELAAGRLAHSSGRRSWHVTPRSQYLQQQQQQQQAAAAQGEGAEADGTQVRPKSLAACLRTQQAPQAQAAGAARRTTHILIHCFCCCCCAVHVFTLTGCPEASVCCQAVGCCARPGDAQHCKLAEAASALLPHAGCRTGQGPHLGGRHPAGGCWELLQFGDSVCVG